MESVEKVAEVVLYEGYLLYPYTRSTLKNQQRWTFGGVYPRQFSEAGGGNDPWLMQTQCLIERSGDTTLEGKVRFLQVISRTVHQSVDGALEPVDELRAGAEIYRPWEESVEREILLGELRHPLRLEDLADQPHSIPIAIPGGSSEEPVAGSDGEALGVLVREWESLEGAIELSAEKLHDPECYRLTITILNTLPVAGPDDTLPERNEILRRTFISTHTILQVHNGEFVSLLEPEEPYREAAASCENIKTWPVLAGTPGTRTIMLSSPIILYDYPQVSPQSPVNFFDTTEIDELLVLSVMTLTDEEKQEMRETDPRARAILDRTESLSPEELMNLHGSIRSLQELRREGP